MRYHTIVADPPWPQKGTGPALDPLRAGWGKPVGEASRPIAYPTMTISEIGALPVGELAERDAHLYLWTTNRFLGDAFAVLQEWGFSYSTTLVWAKAPMGTGLGGCYRISTEYVLFARRGHLPALSRIDRNWFPWKRPSPPKHSTKPADFFTMVETVSPAPRLELFARGTRLGWDAWGNEADTPIEWAV
jgi:N6-adenosine-specific RNA methylase IME4